MADQCDCSQIGLATPATYRIVVRGRLDRSWSNQLGGLDIHAGQGAHEAQLTTLTGRLIDQAALFGVLSGLYDLGFALVSVECLQEANS